MTNITLNWTVYTAISYRAHSYVNICSSFDNVQEWGYVKTEHPDTLW